MNNHKTVIRNGLRILCFIFLLIIADQVMGRLMHHLYFNQRTGQSHSLTFVLSRCTADVLILGNSRAQHHYNPDILADSLKMNCYNAGMDGGHSIFLPYAEIMVILARYTPKIIIIDLGSMNALDYDPADYEKLSILDPYYSQYPELNYFRLIKGPYEKFKFISSIYPYNSKIITMLLLNTNFHNDGHWMVNGYLPIKNKTIDVSKIKRDNLNGIEASIDTTKVSALKKIISLCRNSKVQLYFTMSPRYQVKNNLPSKSKESQKLLLKIINSNGIPIINCGEDEYFQEKPYLFADQGHLNEKGATLFSTLMGGIIKNRYITDNNNSYLKNMGNSIQ